ncbi:MAG: DNA mismatch repair protein MutS, partial [Alphaproteobacteria bacterium]|nr:DNA mismatch repair protein MutS [Alphaproteobacteria bacterium]
AQLAALMPREVLLPERLDSQLQARFDEVCAGASITPLPAAQTGTTQGVRALTQAYGVDTLDGFGTFSRPALAAAGMLAIYVELTQMGKYPQLKPPKYVSSTGHMRLDSATRNNLELTQTLSGNRQGSLLSAIDLTQSGAGARLLAARLSAPSTDIEQIKARHLAIDYFADSAKARTQLRADIRVLLRRLPDMARSLARLSLMRGGPRDLAAIRDGIKTAFAISQLMARHTTHHMSEQTPQPIERTDDIAGDRVDEIVDDRADDIATEALNADFLDEPRLGELHEALLAIQPSLVRLADLAAHLDKALAAELPVLTRDGGFIAAGYKAELDATHDIRNERRRHIAGLQAEYVKATGIKALKVKHNAVLGYYVDVPSMHGDKLMRAPHNEIFIHRQTLANSVRFSTEKLAQFAGEISRADERALGLELAIFDQLSKETLEAAPTLSAAAEALAVIDIATAQAELAITRQWIRPSMFKDTRFIIKAGRHPVVETALAAQQKTVFVANDCLLNA